MRTEMAALTQVDDGGGRDTARSAEPRRAGLAEGGSGADGCGPDAGGRRRGSFSGGAGPALLQADAAADPPPVAGGRVVLELRLMFFIVDCLQKQPGSVLHWFARYCNNLCESQGQTKYDVCQNSVNFCQNMIF